MPQLAGIALRTLHGDLAATCRALAEDRPGPRAAAGRLGADPIAVAAACAAEAAAGRPIDLLLFAATKGDLPAWLAAIGDAGGIDHPAGGVPGSLGATARQLAQPFGCPGAAVSAACASVPAALGVAARAIAAGRARRVLVVAADAITAFIDDGFAALRARDPSGAHPYDAERAGLSLGEVAGAVLVSADDPGPGLAGWGGSLDANHLTGPTRDGSGLAAACRAALGEAPPDLVVGHGTGTRYNDDSESLAYAAVRPGLPVTGCKGGLGHSLGACGLAEAALAAHAIAAGWTPGVAGLRRAGTAGAIAALPPGRHDLRPRRVLCANAGFGGINHAVAIGGATRSGPGAGAVLAQRIALDDGDFLAITAASALGRIDPGWGRMDAACRGLCALALRAELPAAAAVVLLTDAACAASDRAFERHRGQPGGDPQRFPYTLPTTPIGEASIRRQLRGPGLCLAGGDDAWGRQVAADLIADGIPAVLLARVEADRLPHRGWAEVWRAA